MLSLALGTFALGIAEFGMMGILGDVASGLDISITEAGHLISAYSIGVAIGAPCLLLLRRWPLKRLMIALASLIAIGNAGAAIAPGFIPLLLFRFIAGLPHGAYFGAGAIVCSRLAGPGNGAKAVAIMVGGMTVANVVGVPGATLVSDCLSWRIAFAIVAVCGVAALCGLRFFLPRLEALPDTGLKGQFHFLKSAAPWLIYAGVFLGQASVYCYFSYIDPVMTEVAGVKASTMTWIMMIAGLGMVAGNFTAGSLADRYPAAIVTGCISVLIVIVMTAIYFAAHNAVLLTALTFVATACLFGLGGPLQYLIVRFSKGGEMLGGAGIQIAFNVSNAMAAAIGGAVINMGWGLAATALVGIPFAAVGAVALFTLSHKYNA